MIEQIQRVITNIIERVGTQGAAKESLGTVPASYRMSTCRRKMGRISCTPEFLLFKKCRWLIYLVLMGVVARIVVMCVLHGAPSFCPNCILYWGNHNFNGSGMHLPEHALFML